MENASKAGLPTLRFILFAFALVLVVSVALIGGLVVVAANSQNQIATRDSVHLTRSVLAAIERRLADQLLDYSYWDEAVANLVANRNLDWADNNIGIYMYDKFGIDSSFVLDADNRPVYAMMAGKRRDENPLLRFSGGVDRLIARTRANPPTEAPKPVAGILHDGKAIHIAAVSVLTNFFNVNDRQRKIGTGWVLMFTRRLDEKLLANIAESYRLESLRLVGTESAALSTALPLSAADGSTLGYLTWRVESPAWGMLRWLLPLIGIVILIFAATAYVFVRKTQTVTATLLRQLDEIQSGEEALRASEHRYRTFAADVAHELRTPLAVLRAQLDNIQDSKIAAALCADIDQMSRMVSQLLAATQLDWVALDADDMADLRAVCTSVAAHLAPIAIRENKSLEVVGVDHSVIVHGNADALEQAVRNLVENAIRYSARKTTVTIKVSDEPAIHVLDRGCGVPADKRQVVFRRFQRSDRRGGGSGLGLAIVQRTAEIHGAIVEVNDRPGGGAVFSFRFPKGSLLATVDDNAGRATEAA